MESENLGELFHSKPRLALQRHMALVRLRVEELKANPEYARWRSNADGSVYRMGTDISRALHEATVALDFENSYNGR